MSRRWYAPSYKPPWSVGLQTAQPNFRTVRYGFAGMHRSSAPPPHGGTHRCRPTNTNGLPTWSVGRDLRVPPPVRTIVQTTLGHSRNSGATEGRRPPPTDGVGPTALGRTPQGLRHLRMALWDAGVFRAVRGAGVSPAAAGGYFVPCAARVFRPLRRAGISRRARRDQRRCLWTPRFIEKNRVKLLYFYQCGLQVSG